jgi:hypothetical protein
MTRLDYRELYCPHCEKSSLHVREVTIINHALHAILSLLLCGWWLIVWLVLAMNPAVSRWQCTRCARENIGGCPFAPPQPILAEAIEEL